MFNYFNLFTKYGNPKGIIHIGSQFMYSRVAYLNMGYNNTIWLESNPFFYELGLSQLNNTNEKIYNLSIGNENIVVNYKVNNESNYIEIPSISLQDLFNKENIDENQYDFIHIGIQNGGTINFDGINIEKFKYLSLEVNENFNKNLFGDSKNIHRYLTKLRYKKIEKIVTGNISHVLYVKKRKYNKK